ncbi:MAG TPA: hypothetical protein VKT82_01660 [Ktedonobacterales bacterium]|nr:hypothetical protein [Ktedonobacterales bacterium]
MPKKKRETQSRTPIDYEAHPDKKQDWYSVPRDVADYMFLVGANTWRILSFTLDATNYTNQAEPKRITLDEFRSGRKQRDRSRLHTGTSASEPTILSCIREGIASDTLYVEADGHDQGRIQKRYAVIAPDNPGRGVQLTPEGLPWIKLVQIGVYYLSEWTVQQHRALLAVDAEKRTHGDKNAKKEVAGDLVTPIPLCYFDRAYSPEEAQEVEPLSNYLRAGLKKLETPLTSSGSRSKEMRDRSEEESQETLVEKHVESKGGAPSSVLKTEKNKEDEKDRPPPPADASEVDALAQRQADQHILQQLLAEQEQLRQAKPSQAGWGEAQRRLRFLAREISRLQLLVPPLSTAPGSPAPATAPGQTEPTEQRRSPPSGPPIRKTRDQAASAAAPPALDPRRERLMQLQRELAQLKRTPSMQLLARQRIPKLEAEIKQLISELQESA